MSTLTLTQTCLKLLEKEENRELVNTVFFVYHPENKPEYWGDMSVCTLVTYDQKPITTFHFFDWWDGDFRPVGKSLDENENFDYGLYDGDNLNGTLFEDLLIHKQREVIRVCLEVLPFFERENNEYTDRNNELKFYEKECSKQGNPEDIHKVACERFDYLCGYIKILPKSLKAKYQQLLYLPISEIDTKFADEGITENDLK